jgi:hypothetical protein
MLETKTATQRPRVAVLVFLLLLKFKDLSEPPAHAGEKLKIVPRFRPGSKWN